MAWGHGYDTIEQVVQAMQEGAQIVVAVDETFEAAYYVQRKDTNVQGVKISKELAEQLPWGRMYPVSVGSRLQKWELMPGF